MRCMKMDQRDYLREVGRSGSRGGAAFSGALGKQGAHESRMFWGAGLGT